MTSPATINAADADEASEMTLMRQAVDEALAYLTDKDDIESTPGHAIGHAVTALRRVRPAPRTAAERNHDLAELVRAAIVAQGFDPDAFWGRARKLTFEPVQAERCLNDDRNPCGRCSLCRAHEKQPADLIYCFRDDGATVCTSYHGDSAWDTPRNRRLTFEFITRAEARGTVGLPEAIQRCSCAACGVTLTYQSSGNEHWYCTKGGCRETGDAEFERLKAAGEASADPDPCGCDQAEALQAELGGALKRIRQALPHLKHRECCTQNVYVAKAIAVLEGKP